MQPINPEIDRLKMTVADLGEQIADSRELADRAEGILLARCAETIPAGETGLVNVFRLPPGRPAVSEAHEPGDSKQVYARAEIPGGDRLFFICHTGDQWEKLGGRQ